MRLYEIIGPLSAEDMAEIDRICAPDMPDDVRAEIKNAWRRTPPVQLGPDEMRAMYGGGDEREETELRKLRAEANKAEAEADCARAEAAAHRLGSSRSS